MSTYRPLSYTFDRLRVSSPSPANMPTPVPGAPPQPHLLGLPDKVLLGIVKLVAEASPNDVITLGQTCKRMHEVCEPVAFRVLTNRDAHYKSQALLLEARPERYAYVKIFAVHTQQIVQVAGISKMLWPMSKFINLEVLHISEDSCQPSSNPCLTDTIFSMVNGVLTHCAFPNLRKCTLFSKQRRPVIIDPILKAPNLTTLAVSFPIFDPTDDSLPSPNSTALKRLTLMVDPRMDLNVVLSMIRMPKALETLEFDDSRIDASSVHHPGILPSILAEIARSQGGLSTLKLFLAQRHSMSKPSATGAFDFRRFANLKMLSLTNHCSAPFNCFVKLPAGLQTLRLNSYVNLDKLAEKMHIVKRRDDFSCPPVVEISQDFHLLGLGHVPPVPLTPSAHQKIDDKTCRFRDLVHVLPCQTLVYVERDLRRERRFTAVKVKLGGNMCTADGRGYEVSQRVRERHEWETDGEHAEKYGSDLYLWRRYVHHRPFDCDTEFS